MIANDILHVQFSCDTIMCVEHAWRTISKWWLNFVEQFFIKALKMIPKSPSHTKFTINNLPL